MSEVIRYSDIQPRVLAPGVTIRDKRTTDTLNIAEVTFQDGAEYPVGAYAVNADVQLVIEGLYSQCVIQRRDREDIVLNAGATLVIPPNTPYRYVSDFGRVNLTSTPPWTPDQYTEEPLE